MDSTRGSARVWTRAGFAAMATIPTMLLFQSRIALAVGGNWTGTSGNWNDPTHWTSNPQVPNDYPSTNPTATAFFTNPKPYPTYTATVTTPTTVDEINVTDPNATISVDSAEGATLNFEIAYLYGTLSYDGDTTLSELNTTHSVELEAFNGSTVNLNGHNLTSHIFIAGEPNGATINFENLNTFTNYGSFTPDGTTDIVGANSIVNHGTLTIANSGTINAGGAAVNLADGVLDDTVGWSGTLDGAVTFTSATALHEGVNQYGNPAYDLIINSSTPTLLAGTLSLINQGGGDGTILSPTATYTILQNAAGFTGQFANAPDGARIYTNFNEGSFIVHYEPTSVVLTDWIPATPIPEPAGTAVLLIGGLALIRRRARRNRATV
jgi:hypothetical protein